MRIKLNFALCVAYLRNRWLIYRNIRTITTLFFILIPLFGKKKMPKLFSDDNKKRQKNFVPKKHNSPSIAPLSVNEALFRLILLFLLLSVVICRHFNTVQLAGREIHAQCSHRYTAYTVHTHMGYSLFNYSHNTCNIISNAGNTSLKLYIAALLWLPKTNVTQTKLFYYRSLHEWANWQPINSSILDAKILQQA